MLKRLLLGVTLAALVTAPAFAHDRYYPGLIPGLLGGIFGGYVPYHDYEPAPVIVVPAPVYIAPIEVVPVDPGPQVLYATPPLQQMLLRNWTSHVIVQVVVNGAVWNGFVTPGNIVNPWGVPYDGVHCNQTLYARSGDGSTWGPIVYNSCELNGQTFTWTIHD